jgi:uncharacterized protein (TIGR00255 family)
MINSMTGFARCEANGIFGELTCELRSVNHRFLEASFRLPEELRGIEGGLRQTLQLKLKRGKVDCSLHWRSSAGGAQALDIDNAALQRVLSSLRDIGASMPDGNARQQINLVDVLRWPGVVRETATDANKLQEAARTLFERALGELIAMRESEGQRLSDLLLQRCAAIEALVAQVRSRLPEVQARVRSRLQEKLRELQAVIDNDRVEQELVMLLQRLDVAEELDRLSGHLEETRRVMSAGEAAGRRLDFLMQEFNREANTLSSKSQDLETTRLAVDIKVLIEQMREQVQNVE